MPKRPELELGFRFAREHWGHGYATDAASACLAWALAHRTERGVAIVDPQHGTSQRVLTKLGMQLVGCEQILGHTWSVYEAAPDLQRFTLELRTRTEQTRERETSPAPPVGGSIVADVFQGSAAADRVADEAAIRELLRRQQNGRDSGDPALYADVFTADADYVTFSGRRSPSAYCRPLRARCRYKWFDRVEQLEELQRELILVST